MWVPDEVLVRKMRRGGIDAFDMLVVRYLREAYAAAFAIDGRNAGDICRDAFLMALDRIDECPFPELFEAWLLEIVKGVGYARLAQSAEESAGEPTGSVRRDYAVFQRATSPFR